MAPEILNKSPYNHKVDIWSLGVSIYEMLTGKHPFSAISKSDLKFKHCLGKYKI
jgi:NIMA (never in mitosis gene a)-related kinase